jgi:hypothetical protein
MTRRIALPAALAAATILAALGGCEMKLKPGAEGLLDALNSLPEPSEMAAQAIDKYDANNRYIGTLGLATQNYANEPVYIRLFCDNINDKDPAVRAAAARGLANHGEPSHVPLLIKALKDENVNVRLEAARGLQRLYNEEAVAPLIEATREPVLRDPGDRTPPEPSEPDAEVRAQAAQALGQYAQARVLQALIACLDDSDLAVNRNALASLRTLTGQDFGLDRSAWVEWSGRTQAPFAGRRLYIFPAFSRAKRWYEYLPFVPRPPNEAAAPPVGLPR